MYRLSTEFEIVSSSVQVFIDYGLEVITGIMCDPHSTDFAVSWPGHEKNQGICCVTLTEQTTWLCVKGIFAVTDGARMPYANYSNLNIQNA